MNMTLLGAIETLVTLAEPHATSAHHHAAIAKLK